VFIAAGRGVAIFPTGDPSFWMVQTPEGQNLGIVRDLLATKWNAREVPQEPGRHDVVLAVNAELVGGSPGMGATVSATVTVSEMYHFGQWPVQTKGLQDAKSGALSHASRQNGGNLAP